MNNQITRADLSTSVSKMTQSLHKNIPSSLSQKRAEILGMPSQTLRMIERAYYG
jgi:hypothetical protein